MHKPKFPSISSLRSKLAGSRRHTVAADFADGETPGTDCRLRVLPEGGGWQLLTGSADYDQDHRGYWGAGFLPLARTNLTELARDLIDQAKEHSSN